MNFLLLICQLLAAALLSAIRCGPAFCYSLRPCFLSLPRLCFPLALPQYKWGGCAFRRSLPQAFALQPSTHMSIRRLSAAVLWRTAP
jgi:hypothetical protein